MNDDDRTGPGPDASIPALRAMTPPSAGRARTLTRQVLQGVPQRVIDDCLLVVSELFTNAIRHAGGPAGFGITAQSGHVAISVRDCSDELPCVIQRTQPGRAGGYGWPMVCKLAENVTITLTAGSGKTIHASLAY